MVVMAFEKYKELQPRDARPALVSHFPFVMGYDVPYLFEGMLVGLVRVFACGDRPYDEYA